MRKIVITAIFVFTIQNSWAEPADADKRSETVIVTATRTAQTVDESLSSVSVITHEDIERQNATSLLEVLQSVAGMSTASYGGQGTLSSLFMRGTNSSHVLVIIDGIKVGSVASGTTSFEFIPVEQIDRIEIVRGPRSSLYGSEAIGGVIQIFTRKGDGKKRPSVSLSAGSYETYKAVAAFSGGDEQTNYSLSLSSYDTKGFNGCDGDPLLGGCYTFEPDDDAYRYTAGSMAVDHKFSASTSLTANVMQSSGNVKFDGYYNGTDFLQQVAGANLSHEISESSFVKLQLGQSKDERDNFNNATYLDFTNTERNTVSLQNDILIGEEIELTLGLDYLDDRLESDTSYNRTSRTNKGFFLQFLQDMGRINFQLSMRNDANQQFGNYNTGSIAWGYEINQQKRITLSYGTAFKAPTFVDLYYPFGSNPDLNPEESKSIELGYRSRQKWGTWSLNAFQTSIENLIVWNGVLSMPENIEDAEINGVEFILQTTLWNWSTQLDASLLDPENRSGANKGNTLHRRAKKSARIVLARDYSNYEFGATIVFNGKRYDDAANTVVLDSYYTVDFNGAYQIDKSWKIKASAKNIFDEDYELVKYYNTPGRNYLVTVSYAPSNW